MIELIDRQLSHDLSDNTNILIPHGFLIRTKTWSHNDIKKLIAELINGHPSHWSDTLYLYVSDGEKYIDIYNNKRVLSENILPEKGRWRLYCIAS